MKRIQIIGMCLAAVFAFSAIAASSALALPEFVKPSSGAFPKNFTSTNLATDVAELNTAEHKIKCPSILDVGTILPQPSTTSSMLGDIEFTFHGCSDELGDSCKSTGQPSGLILTPTYLFHLVLLFLPPSTKHTLIVILVSTTKFICGSGLTEAKVTVSGNLVGQVPTTNMFGEKDFNENKTRLDVIFKQKAAGEQEFTSYELPLNGLALMTKEELTSVTETILGTKTEKASEVATGTETLEGGQTVELKA